MAVELVVATHNAHKTREIAEMAGAVIASPSNEYGGELTPDQSWVAFGSDETSYNFV